MKQQKTTLAFRTAQVASIFILLSVFVPIISILIAEYFRCIDTKEAVIIVVLSVGLLGLGSFLLYLSLAIKTIKDYKKNKFGKIKFGMFVTLSSIALYTGLFGALYTFILVVLYLLRRFLLYSL